MDAFDNPARGANGLSRTEGDVTGTATANGEARAIAPTALADTAAGVTAAASAIPLAIQAVLIPDARGRITLPAGVSIDDIGVSGPDLIITLPDGRVLVVPNGAVDIPAVVVGGNTVPASTVAQLLEGLDEFNPEAGLRSSGGNFADPEGAIQDAYDLGDLLPYTELAFPAPRDEELIPDRLIPDEDATVVIQTPDQPAGSTDATSSVDEAGLPARGSEPAGSNSAANSETTTGTIVISAPDGLASVTINGTAVTSVGQTITTPLGTLTITSIAPGAIGYSYTLADNTDANANLTDVFTVVVTDVDGDTASANLTISIIDDVPTARADTDAVAPATYTAETGNVISGTGTTSGAAGADTRGADGATLTGVVAGTGTAFVAPGTAIAGQYGTLTISADGSYSYVRAPNTPGGVTDVFTYRLTDGDGDTSTATLTISIGDSPAIITFVPTQGAGTVVDESQLPPRADESEGSAFDGDDESTTGTITFTSPDGVQSVTINGVAVTPGALPQTIFTDATGTLVVNSYAYDPVTGQGSITYTYTLADNTADPDGTTVSFDVVVTDLDGDSAPAVLNIDIVDDVPIARDDADSVTEDGPLVADGNVLTGVGGSDANATDGVADTQGADGATVTAIAGGSVGTAFATAYGTLTVNADGSYTYVLNNALQPVQGLSAGETLTESFLYTITDGDGDTSTATLTITINGADDGVTITGLDTEGGELTVDEDDLPNGSSPDPVALAPSGSFSISTPDGLGNVTIGGTQVVTNGVFTAGSATSPLGTVNITGFTPVIGADGSVIGGSFTYEYVLSANTLTHGSAGEDSVTDSFAVTVTDSDGSVGTASLDVNIVDDVPTARDDADNVTEDGPLVADGNLLTGTGGSDANATDGVADTQGADGASVTAIAGGSVGTPFATAYGTLTVNADGSYTYALNNALQPVQGLSAGETLSESFVYTITDGDGDTSTATLTITINGADDGVTITGLDGAGAELAFDEDDLPARPNEAAGSDTTPEPVTDGGNFSVSTPDGMGNVVLDSFNGSPIGPLTLVTADGSFTPQMVVTAYGTLSITGFTPVIGADGSVIGGSFTYSYTLSDNRTDHGAAGEDNVADSIGVTVTDIDGSNASATIDIQITDDVPTAIDDFLLQPVENAPVTIDVLANDVQGADSVQSGTVALVDGTLTGSGTLVNNGDGSFTYTQAPGEVGEISFQYQITDGDGDTSTATATIMLVADSTPQIRSADNVTVDEDGLPLANADDGIPGEVTSTGSTSANGTIVVDFGGDVPAVLAGSIVLDDSAALDTQLTVGGVPVTFAKDGADLVGSVGATEVIRIALTTATSGPGANEVTYGYTVTLSAAIDQSAPGSEDSDMLSGIGFTVTDNDGSTASGSFVVTIVDDIPTLAVSDTPTNATEGGPAVNGTWTLDAGADGVTSVTVTFGAGSDTLSLAPGNSVVIVQPTGTLTVNSDGTFSFLAAGDQNNNPNPSATFTLSAVDRDGDPTSDSLTITIDDGADPTGGGTLTLTVDEAAIDGIGRTPASDAETDSGMLSFSAGSDTLSNFMFDGTAGLVANLDGAGTDLFWSISPDGQTITGSLTDGGPAAITISLSAPASLAPGMTGNATVTVTIADNLPHALAMAAQTQSLGTVTVKATDTDGDMATGTVTINVTDDIPTVSAVDGSANALIVDDSDLATDASADFGFGQPGSLFNVAFNADGPAATDSVTYALGVKSPGVASGLVDTATNEAVVLTLESGAVVGRTSGTNDIVFVLSVDANGTVTLDQQRAVFHSPDSGPDQSAFLSAADLVTLTATVTDSDGDQASATANIGGALTFKDDGVSIDINVTGEAAVVLTTQDAATIGAASDSDVSTANFGSVFSFANADFGADGPGAISWSYALTLFGANGTDSGLDSNGASINLFNDGGTIVGSTAASLGDIDPGNTIFTISVNAGDGTVTLTQFAQIDHELPGVGSNFDSQIATLADELVRLTGTVTITDKDGDSDSDSQSIDLGHNIRFADDGPDIDVTLKAGAELRIDETDGVTAAGTEVDPVGGNLGSATIAATDLFTVTLDAGADTPASYSYAFVLGGVNPDSGYRISSDDEVIRLYQTAPGTVEGRGETSGDVAFTFTVAADGTVTMTQFIAIEHGDTGSHDESSPGMNAGALLLEVKATDFDGDFDTDTVDLGSIIRIEDDGPSISNVGGSGSVTLDETGGLDVNVTSLAAVITATLAFGADGPAAANSTVYGLALSGGAASGIATAVGDFPITLVATSPTTITGRYTDGGGIEQDAFTVTINTDGTITVSQFVALEHLQDGDTPLHNDALTLDGLITASIRITDSDGDSVDATKEIGGQISFLDDGPSVSATAAGAVLVQNDESATNSMVAQLDTGSIAIGNDPDVAGAGAISRATSSGAVVNATPLYGTDGAAATGALSYSLTVINAVSGLSVTDGSPINLVVQGNVIVGQVSGGAFDGLAAFAIAIDPATGVVTVEQYLSLDHPDTANPDDTVQLVANSLGVVVTATDSDGDFALSDTVDISAQIRFDDDGPQAMVSAAGLSLAHDETPGIDGDAQDVAGPLSIFDGVANKGDDPDVAGTVIGFARDAGALSSAGSTTGSDGGTISFGLSLSSSGVDSGLDTTDGQNILLYLESGIVVGRVGGPAGAAAFAIAVEADGSVNLVQYLSIKHPTPGASHDESLSIVNGAVLATVTVTDGDGDTSSASTPIGGLISFQDDGPVLTPTDGPEMLTLLNQAGSASGSFMAAFGADGSSGFNITGPVINGITYTETDVTDGSGNFLRTELLAETADGTDVFKITVNADGTYTFDLITPNAATEEEISFAKLGAGGPGFRELDDDPNTALNEAGRVEFQSNGSGVNASTPGFGVSNQWTDQGEWFELEFHNPGNFGVNDAPQTNADLLNSVTLNVQQVASGPVDFTWTATRYNPDGTIAATETGNFTVSAAGDVTIDPSIEFSVLRIDNVDTDPQARVRFSTDVSVSRTVLPPDQTYVFDVVGTDGDADTSNVLQISVFIDEPSVPPIVLDLDGDGVEFLSASAGVSVDYFGDGTPVPTAWVGPDDGLLAFDANGNGRVDNGSEIVFGGNGLTDLQGLAAKYDSNGDGLLTSADAGWAGFGVWRDANSNGVSDDGEFQSLDDAGIVSINLQSDGQPYSAADGDVHVFGETSYQLADGTVRTAADAAFAYGKAGGTSTVRTQDRPASAVPLSDALVAASLVAMVHAVQPERADAASIADSEVAGVIGGSGAAHSVDTGTAHATKMMADDPLLGSAEPRADEPASRNLGGGDDSSSASSVTGHGADASYQHAASGPEWSGSEALFDHFAPAANDGAMSMDGLLSLGLAAIDARIAARDVAADDPAAARVLAEAIDGGESVDRLIDAVTGAAAVPDGHAAPVDLARMLDAHVVGGEMAGIFHPPADFDLQQIAAA
ncbi:beta strand repeat-containing protein [Sphingopyxis sp. P8]|uniref:beta strand repeat-containing protein n=1 Tax=Sphingopyxis sp. P8 TaxID=2763256 RepID=UPI001D0B6955|nr:DUF5801 repeats-in-toxin domain-containing protein [Sphingopyxis sp. P8]